LEDVLDLDLARDRDAVVGDCRRAELLVQHDVPTLRAKRDLDRVGEDVHAPLERAARILVELQLLVSHSASSLCCYAAAPAGSRMPTTLASTSDSRRIRTSSEPSLTSVPPYFEKMISSPSATSIGTSSPLSLRLPGPTARTLPRCGFSFAVSGRTIPLVVVSSSSRTSTIRRSPSGCRSIQMPPCYGLCDTAWHSPMMSARRFYRRPSGSRNLFGESRRLCYNPPGEARILGWRRPRPQAQGRLDARGDPAGRQGAGRVGAAEGEHRPRRGPPRDGSPGGP